MSLQDDVNLNNLYEFENIDNTMKEIDSLINQIDIYTEKENMELLNIYLIVMMYLNQDNKNNLVHCKYFYSNKNIYFEYLNLLDYYVKVFLYYLSHNYPM